MYIMWQHFTTLIMENFYLDTFIFSTFTYQSWVLDGVIFFVLVNYI